MTKEELEQLQHRLKSAGIPPRLWRMRTADFRGKASDLFSYLSSPAYSADMLEGRGINVYGPATYRQDLFALIAKGFAAQGQSVTLITVHALLWAIENDQDKRSHLAKVKNLFIDGFEKEFTKEHDCPYTFFQQAEIEEFLQGRRNGDLLNNYSTHSRWTSMRWWSRDFIAANSDAVREIAV